MGQAYGFGYDETPSHPAPPSGYSQFPNVPSKFDPVPSGTSTINITFGPWTSTPPSGPTSTHYFSVGTGPGQASTVNVYGIDQQGHRTLVTTLHPFASSFTGGVNLATGDLNGDGTDDILVSAGPFGQTNVKVYNGKTFAVLYSFRAFPEKAAQSAHIATFVASADVNNDGYDDIITGAGEVYTPLVRVYSGKDGSLLKQFTAFGNGFRGGVRGGRRYR